MIRSVILMGIVALLSGCYFDYPLTGTTQAIDPALAGEWRDSNKEITVEVRAAADGYRLRYTDNDGTYLFDNATILHIGGEHFLQARFYGEQRADGSIDDTAKEKPWLVLAFERKDGKIIVRVPDTDEKYIPRNLKSAREFKAAFKAASQRDGFLGPPMTFEKSRP
jgi:hypothetical protein